MAKILLWGKRFYMDLSHAIGGPGEPPVTPGLDFSKAVNSQYIILLEDI
jgi:hypothetical protein